MPFPGVVAVIAALSFAMMSTGPAAAQRTGQTPMVFDMAGIDERLDETIPTHLTFRDEDGTAVELARYFDGRTPVLLALIYHDCPMLCSLVLHGLTTTMQGMSWVAGDRFEVLAVSFAPDETPEQARRAKDRYVAMLGRPEAAGGWHFLTGSETSIHALTEAVGFRYSWVEEIQDYAHPSALVVLDGNGRISRYMHGIQYDPAEVRTALTEAAQGRIRATLDQIILYCFQFDPNSNSYVLHAVNAMKVGGMLTLLVLGSVLVFYWRRETQMSHRIDHTPQVWES